MTEHDSEIELILDRVRALMAAGPPGVRMATEAEIAEGLAESRDLMRDTVGGMRALKKTPAETSEVLAQMEQIMIECLRGLGYGPPSGARPQ